MIRLHPQPLTGELFSAYGDVIESGSRAQSPMNDGRFERFDSLARIEGGATRISIVRGLQATALPHRIDAIERHPGSQAFVPLSPFVMVVVVAPATDDVSAGDLAAFVTDGNQGINYHAGTWHMPLIALEAGQRFLVIDQGQQQPAELRKLVQPVMLAELH